MDRNGYARAEACTGILELLKARRAGSVARPSRLLAAMEVGSDNKNETAAGNCFISTGSGSGSGGGYGNSCSNSAGQPHVKGIRIDAEWMNAPAPEFLCKLVSMKPGSKIKSVLRGLSMEDLKNMDPNLLLTSSPDIRITEGDVQPFGSICKQAAFAYIIQNNYYVQAYDLTVHKESYDNSQACIRKKNGWFCDLEGGELWKDVDNKSRHDTDKCAFIYNSRGEHISLDEILQGETMIFVVGTHSGIEKKDMDASYESLAEHAGVHIVTLSSNGSVTIANKAGLDECFVFEKHGHLFVYGLCTYYVGVLHHDPAIDLYDANTSDYLMYTDVSARPLRLGVIIAMWGRIFKMLKGVKAIMLAKAAEEARKAEEAKAAEEARKAEKAKTTPKKLTTPKKRTTPKAKAAKRALNLM